ncbi:DUF72 domain-containing protein [Aestuariibacter salexigens]|uniref:DUF72 domain-containing protein n=1 Tax=Aestuariibacter salexigens TaxID=226010 RepID=UPI00041F0E28|nr:DUF72 domain-containing protein [Aestuariibacter salexigens]
MWSHPYWFGRWFSTSTPKQEALSHYARRFNSVEGNTTFYHLPDETTVHRWNDSVGSQFRFSFKFHQDISHKGTLTESIDAAKQQLRLLSSLQHKLGLMMLQLPASFDPSQLPDLRNFLSHIAPLTTLAVEVRHPLLFAKGDDEARLNRMLMDHGVNRIIMDTRALFSADANGDDLLTDVQAKKPRVPVNVIATADHPVVRYVGHPDLSANRAFLEPWVRKVTQWLNDGKDVTFFLHMPDNGMAPWLAELFAGMLRDCGSGHDIPDINLPSLVTQDSLL